jgi:phage gp16-like protein
VAWELKDWKTRTPGGFEVDGAIRILSSWVRADVVEVKCGVQLVLSTGNGNAIIMMTSGEAIVEWPKRQFRPAMRPAMERDALEQAVRAAAQEIRQRFVANGP